MAGHRKFSELRAKLSPERRRRVDAKVREMEAEMLLREIRQLAGLTQEQLAESMGVTQSALSRLESQDDMYVSTLQRIVESLGGRLEIIADLPNGRIALSQFRRSA
jgi:DNA-binding XRE family transcriptional regulator